LASLDPVPWTDFELGKPIGYGGVARVFEAIDRKTGQPVALKLLDASARGSHELRERLAREAVLLGAVQSPHVSGLLGHGWDGDQPFLVLERLQGETLADYLRREGRLSVARLIDWVEQLLLGVRDCHRANIIHRDVKPSNIFLAQGEGEATVKLIDFGVARIDEIVSAGSGLTNTHHLIGSIGYMAPEQVESARDVSPAADLYAVGVVVFRCVTGRLPFLGRSIEALTKLKCEGTAPAVSSIPGVVTSALLDAFVARALSRHPDARFATAGEMLQEWWRVGAALDRDTPLAEVEIVFDEDEWVSTLVESLVPKHGRDAAPASSAAPGPSGPSGPSAPSRFSSATLRVAKPAIPRPSLLDDDAATDPELSRPTDSQIMAMRPAPEPPGES
jgi:serine/threonine-protein kinase